MAFQLIFMNGTEFKTMVQDVAEKEMKRRAFIRKILKLAIGLWVSLISMGELMYWATPSWWSIPLGITFVLMVLGFGIAIIDSFID